MSRRAAPRGRLAQLLGGLDGALASFEGGPGAVWRETVVIAATEFGRAARVNGDSGCDHGAGTVAFLAGGAVAGGRVVADWPGLRPQDLHENRDLRPKLDLRAILKGVLADHVGLSSARLAETVFPDSAAVMPAKGLIAG